MTDHKTPQVADIKQKKDGLSFVWLIPLLTFLIGGWLVYQQWRDQGPEITIHLPSASGLEENKTQIRTRDVNVGKVTHIALDPSMESVTIKARMDKGTEHLLGKSSQFWVVRPRISSSGVSGLSTLLSGTYIELSPSKEKEKAKVFEGFNEPPVTALGTPGLHIVLNSDTHFNYSVGDPVVYKGLKVGQFEDIQFNLKDRNISYQVFIQAPYHELITSNTLFWDISGLHLELSSEGFNLQTGNLESLLSSGVTFGIPQGTNQGEAIQKLAEFKIHEDFNAAIKPNYKHAAEYILLVEDSVRGLNVGAPVEYRGIPIGTVKAINFESPNSGSDSNVMDMEYRIPILIAIEPGRIGLPDTEESVEFIKESSLEWIHYGLKAQLQTGNLLTGQLFVDFQMFPGEEPEYMETFQGYTVLPSKLNDFSQLTQLAGNLLDKFNDLPLEPLTETATDTLASIGSTANKFEQTGARLEQMLKELNPQQSLDTLNQTMEAFATLAESYSEGSASNSELLETLNTLNSRLQELRPLLLQMNQKPNSLIFSGGSVQDVEPKAHSGEGH